MADTSIEWTDKSWNMVAAYYGGKRGWMCSKPSPGCKNCYSEALNLRLGNGLRYTPENVGKVEWRLVNLDEPLRWRKPQKVFVCSMTDLFHEAVPFEFVDKVFAVMALTPQHAYQVLTKRPERMAEYLLKYRNGSFRQLTAAVGGLVKIDYHNTEVNARLRAFRAMGDARRPPLPNVWLGVSVENQDHADKRIPDLLKVPAVVRFLSCEPLLGEINLSPWMVFEGQHEKAEWMLSHYGSSQPLSQVIAGGESGPKARPSHPDWFRSLRDQCNRAGVAYFHKQNGEFLDFEHLGEGWNALSDKQRENQVFLQGSAMIRVGKKAAGRLLDGREWNEFPQ